MYYALREVKSGRLMNARDGMIASFNPSNAPRLFTEKELLRFLAYNRRSYHNLQTKKWSPIHLARMAGWEIVEFEQNSKAANNAAGFFVSKHKTFQPKPPKKKPGRKKKQ